MDGSAAVLELLFEFSQPQFQIARRQLDFCGGETRRNVLWAIPIERSNLDEKTAFDARPISRHIELREQFGFRGGHDTRVSVNADTLGSIG